MDSGYKFLYLPINTEFQQITEALKPTTLEIHNDSHLHSHHKAMQGVTSKETHFRYYLCTFPFFAVVFPS